MNTTEPHIEIDEAASWGCLDDLPGNPMMWILIISELLVFGGFFLGFAGLRIFEADQFANSQAQLDRLLGGVNTLVLLTSGYLAAMAIKTREQQASNRSRLWLFASAFMGVLFLVIKVYEYAAKFDQGIGIDTNSFFTLYFLSTGFHFLHVVLGLVILAVVGWKNSLENMETGICFWHMVDLIWVILYPIAYLIH